MAWTMTRVVAVAMGVEGSPDFDSSEGLQELIKICLGKHRSRLRGGGFCILLLDKTDAGRN